MKKAIVTGASGFLGTWLVRELALNDVEVIAVVRNDSSNISSIEEFSNVRIISSPLCDIINLPSIVKDRDVDVFYHLAWSGTSGMDRGDYKLQLSNIEGACDAVKAASEIGCRKYVYAGSIMEYEVMQYVPADGTKPGLGNIYSTAKLTADFMGKTLATSLNIPYVTAIISNIYGVGEKSARFINTTLRKFLNKEEAAFTSGDQLYDFIYVTDAVRALHLIGKKGMEYSSYYIGNREVYSLKEFIIRMRNVVDKEIPLTFGGIPFNGAKLKYTEFDTKKLYNELGFKTKVSFEQGIEKTLQWIKDNE